MNQTTMSPAAVVGRGGGAAQNGVMMGRDGSMQVFNSSTNIEPWPRRERHDLALPPDQQLRGRRHGGRLHLRLIQLDARHAAAPSPPTEEEDADRDGQLALYLHQHHPLH